MAFIGIFLIKKKYIVHKYEWGNQIGILRWGGMGSDGQTVAYPEICNIEIGIWEENGFNYKVTIEWIEWKMSSMSFEGLPLPHLRLAVYANANTSKKIISWEGRILYDCLGEYS